MKTEGDENKNGAGSVWILVSLSCCQLLQPLREGDGRKLDSVLPQFLPDRLSQTQLHVVLLVPVVLRPADQTGTVRRPANMSRIFIYILKTAAFISYLHNVTLPVSTWVVVFKEKRVVFGLDV